MSASPHSTPILVLLILLTQRSGIDFFVIPHTFIYSNSTLLFQQWFKNQVGKFPSTALSHSHLNPMLMQHLPWLTSLANVFMPNLTPLILVPELFSSPSLLALSTTRISLTIKMTSLSPLLTTMQYQYSATLFPPRSRRKSYTNIAKIAFADLYVPNLVIVVHTALHNRAHVPIVVNSMYFT